MNNFSASEERRQEPESPTQQLDDHGNNVENIGPTTPEASQTEDPQVTSGNLSTFVLFFCNSFFFFNNSFCYEVDV